MNFFRIRAYVDVDKAQAVAALLVRSGVAFEFQQGAPHAEFTLLRIKESTREQEQQYWETVFALAGVPGEKIFVTIRA